MRDVLNPRCSKEGCTTRKYKDSDLCGFHKNEPSTFEQIKDLLITAILNTYQSNYITEEIEESKELPKNKMLCQHLNC